MRPSTYLCKLSRSGVSISVSGYGRLVLFGPEKPVRQAREALRKIPGLEEAVLLEMMEGLPLLKDLLEERAALANTTLEEAARLIVSLPEPGDIVEVSA